MNVELAPEAEEYGRTARRALEAAGGDALVQAAEREPDRREQVVAPALAELGAWELAPRSGGDELEAAAALCRAAGWWALPYPVAERLARPADGSADGLLVVSSASPAAAVAGLHLRWAAVGLDGRPYAATAREPAGPPRTTAFVTALDLVEAGGAAEESAAALGLVLPVWTLLGMLDRALSLVRAHVLDRQQFGQPLSAFQGVQFQLTDAEVERAGLAELAKHALWSLQVGRPDVLDDALALRLAAIEAAAVVFRIAHQLHGAIGFCDETTLSWVSRYSEPLRRLPVGLAGTQDLLTRRLGRRPLAGLFG